MPAHSRSLSAGCDVFSFDAAAVVGCLVKRDFAWEKGSEAVLQRQRVHRRHEFLDR
jgi:hypothetical protein